MFSRFIIDRYLYLFIFIFIQCQSEVKEIIENTNILKLNEWLAENGLKEYEIKDKEKISISEFSFCEYLSKENLDDIFLLVKYMHSDAIKDIISKKLNEEYKSFKINDKTGLYELSGLLNNTLNLSETYGELIDIFIGSLKTLKEKKKNEVEEIINKIKDPFIKKTFLEHYLEFIQHDLVNITEETIENFPKVMKNLEGLPNVGCTCFLNSTIQGILIPLILYSENGIKSLFKHAIGEISDDDLYEIARIPRKSSQSLTFAEKEHIEKYKHVAGPILLFNILKLMFEGKKPMNLEPYMHAFTNVLELYSDAKWPSRNQQDSDDALNEIFDMLDDFRIKKYDKLIALEENIEKQNDLRSKKFKELSFDFCFQSISNLTINNRKRGKSETIFEISISVANLKNNNIVTKFYKILESLNNTDSNNINETYLEEIKDFNEDIKFDILALKKLKEGLMLLNDMNSKTDIDESILKKLNDLYSNLLNFSSNIPSLKKLSKNQIRKEWYERLESKYIPKIKENSIQNFLNEHFGAEYKSYLTGDGMPDDLDTKEPKKRYSFIKQLLINPERIPKVFVIHLKKFDVYYDAKKNDYVSKKLKYSTKNAESITLKKEYFDNGTKDYKYELVGVVNHSGTLEWGHYTANRKQDGSWHTLNDSISSNHGPGFKYDENLAYVLTYKLVEEE